MRIGIFTDSYVPRPDGIAIAVDTMRQALTRAGHEVYVFCPARPGVSHDDPRIITYGSAPAFFYEGLRAAWPLGPRKFKQIEKLDLDIIHIHLPFMMGFAGLRAAKKLNIPVVMSCHQDMDYVQDYPGAFLLGCLILLPAALISGRYKQAVKTLFARRVNKHLPRRYDLVRRVYTFLTDSCDAAVAPSHKIYDQLNIYSRTDNLVLVPNAINPADLPKHMPQARARKILGIHEDAKILITTSRLVREKRIEEAIEGLARIRKKHADAELYIIGDGPCRDALQELVGELGLEECVKFCGLQPHLTVFNYLSASDVYINTCLREIMSLSALEAAAMAKPLIMFDDRLIELVEPGRNGFFVKDIKDMVGKVETLLGDKKLADKLGRRSRRRAIDHYDLATHAKNLEKVYAKIVRG